MSRVSVSYTVKELNRPTTGLQGLSSACFIQGFCIKFIDFNIGYIYRYSYHTTNMSLPNVQCPFTAIHKITIVTKGTNIGY